MISTYYIWFLLFVIIAYLIVIDNNISTAFFYVLKIIKFNYEKQKWWLLNNPKNPVIKYLMWRKSNKIAKELYNEVQMERRSTESNDNC